MVLYVRLYCWYDNKKYEEDAYIETQEACLNCTCSKAVVLCYLRVCPKLLNPPPPGCILLHRYKTCCPELICTDLLTGENDIEGRSEPDEIDPEFEKAVLLNGCLVNGTLYAPGSAMASSSACEYCFCLGGHQRCVKPKCLLRIEGCTPHYDSHNCCPSYYNCTKNNATTEKRLTTTTTILPTDNDDCRVSGKTYSEGQLVLGAGHSACDNCYCIGGILRCEPLSCAPPLLGCAPVIKPGECCASSYNCSGTIETDPQPHYGKFPIVSKEYAQLRTVNEQKHAKAKPKPNNQNDNDRLSYVIAESSATTKSARTPGISGTTRRINENSHDPTTTLTTFQYNNIDKGEEKRNNNFQKIYTTTSVSKIQKDRSDGFYAFEDGRLKRGEDSDESENEVGTTFSTTEIIVSTLEEEVSSTFEEVSTVTVNTENTSENDLELATAAITIKSVVNSVDCNSGNVDERMEETTTEFNELIQDGNLRNIPNNITSNYNEFNTTDATTTFESAEVNLEIKVDVDRISRIPIRNESNANLTKDESSDYDYNDLPPSLPNLKIIPFVAADAVDSKKQTSESHLKTIPEIITEPDPFGFTGLFSPPVKTEGGFVPKSPPLIQNFYGNAFFKPESESENRDVTSAPNAKERKCVSNGQEIENGEPVESNSPCLMCLCLFGNIVCHQPQCPIPEPQCRLAHVQEQTCCPSYICGEDSDSSEAQITPIADFINNAIHTNSPPRFHPNENPVTTTEIPNNKTEPSYSYFEELFHIFTTSTTTEKLRPDCNCTEKPKTMAESKSETENVIQPNGMGLLKLAGCNIYGRMYRVGRIISELSGPCLECMCTEIGVQCKALGCL